MAINYFVSDINKYKEYRSCKEQYFTEENKKEISNVISPCSKYRLIIYSYKTGPSSWSYTEGVVIRLQDNNIVAKVQRNYSSFYYHFHNNYLICGEDYQGYSVINLETETTNIYFPDEAYKGHGFCWSNIVGVYNNKLIVEGCYWACPYDCVVYDITNIEQLPLPELDTYDCDGWATLEDNKLIFKDEKDYRSSDDKCFDDLSNNELKELIDKQSNDSNEELYYSKTVVTKVVEL